MAMGKMNWIRIIVCGLLTGIVWTVLSVISTWFLGAAFNAAVGGNKVFAPSAGLVYISSHPESFGRHLGHVALCSDPSALRPGRKNSGNSRVRLVVR